ncbi:nitrile hydratase accessory protein [Nocardia sp. BSTN01]|uniref:nitrile hydratase accessory protein n=1 Tax=Nocardia sp. BSTN01 TaxID=2783665 RepID=UPI00188EA050|nr:nitrile hydratase accessory protein [Nocardia sp. BSTN01]MBF4998059.1 nitrile hydratase accessory protein [Nocardia sp. BSTN01]
MNSQLDGLPTEDRRRVVEQLLCGLPGGRPGELSFEEPWEIRAFALAVAVHDAGQYQWPAFQSALIGSIRAWEQTHPIKDASWSYYEHWVAALETVLADSGAVESDMLESRTAEVLATPANRNHHEAHLEPIAVDPAVA